LRERALAVVEKIDGEWKVVRRIGVDDTKRNDDRRILDRMLIELNTIAGKKRND